jgi:RP/EB family microtubule-associated protein
MDEGYFVSRLDILRWINHTLILNLQDIEELGSGSVYCQLIDSLYSGRVPMSKVNWRARLEY